MSAARASACAALALLFLAGASSAATAPSKAVLAYSTIDGVSYYMVGGLANGSALVAKTANGELRVPFVGCVYAQLRPDLDHGRVFVNGRADDTTQVSIELSDFSGTGPKQGGIATNTTIDPSLDPALPAGASVRAEAAAWGSAEMTAGLTVDPVTGNNIPANFTDPLGGGTDLDAAVVVGQDSVRDAAGAYRTAPRTGQDEMHLVLTSPGGKAGPDTATFKPVGNLPGGDIASEPEHNAVYVLPNTRFGGQATLEVTSSSKAAPGLNQEQVSVLRPDGSEAANATVQSSALGDGTATLKFDLDQMGSYLVLVSGKIQLGSYSVSAKLDPPAVFQLDLWWTSLVRGQEARDTLNRCQKDIGLLGSVAPVAVSRHKPPLFPLEVVAVAVLVSALAILIIVKFVSETVAAADFKRQFRK